ncbi:SDR family NAD(P)-dependent oxidoreductase [Phytomonospora endophytica]|uniref:NAD(P)-dependent dehydrogenase (Short-subunit alcohol dehydrogenase family) n=1 Tax=Phytomonospora endophytica TaxID=714109 RepID=A0A841FLD0_9ACTN|nr:SDR family NAD(P)-dependent oxidoreductase [Phytomonospora endophytica]MBB6034608.1 NAD(P)-dependent dehydrogenase (short-subunit alcohol dehydrogenase family) [Phytomonospora endophytica]GIG71332.1 short-chain dehydrogenase [Phytomonospora endophytica]
MPTHSGPVAVVTGANRGIGREVCRQLAAEGYEVVLTARDGAKAEKAAAELGVRGFPLDVTGDPAPLAAYLDRAYGRLDVLVNNAAVLYDTWQRAITADLDVVREAAETNLYGPWRLTQALLPLLRRSAHPRVVNVSSESGSLASMGGGTPAYAVTKAGLNALTRMLAAELRGEGVLVNAVCPGWVATDMGGAGGRPVAEGGASVLWAVRLPDDGPTGGFFRDGRPVPW